MASTPCKEPTKQMVQIGKAEGVLDELLTKLCPEFGLYSNTEPFDVPSVV